MTSKTQNVRSSILKVKEVQHVQPFRNAKVHQKHERQVLHFGKTCPSKTTNTNSYEDREKWRGNRWRAWQRLTFPFPFVHHQSLSEIHYPVFPFFFKGFLAFNRCLASSLPGLVFISSNSCFLLLLLSNSFPCLINPFDPVFYLWKRRDSQPGPNNLEIERWREKTHASSPSTGGRSMAARQDIALPSSDCLFKMKLTWSFGWVFHLQVAHSFLSLVTINSHAL